MSATDILSDFMERLDALVLSPVLPVIWAGMKETPPSTGMWLEVRYFPNEPKDLTVDNDSQQDTLGFFQVAVFYRPTKGQNLQIAASEVADLIIAHFPKGFEMNEVRVRKGPWQSPAVDLEGMSFIPVTIPYRGIIGVTGTYVVDGDYYVITG